VLLVVVPIRETAVTLKRPLSSLPAIITITSSLMLHLYPQPKLQPSLHLTSLGENQVSTKISSNCPQTNKGNIHLWAYPWFAVINVVIAPFLRIAVRILYPNCYTSADSKRNFVIICVGGSLKTFHWSQLIFAYFTHFEDKKDSILLIHIFTKNLIYMDS
jgi:hypothetical protein